MSKIVLISDIHYHLFHAFSTDGGRSRLADISNVVQQCFRYCVANNIKHVAILGDIFEKRGIVDSIVYNTFAADLKLFLNAGIEVYIIPGNHDQDLISNATTANSLEPLAKLSPNLHIFSEPCLHVLGGLQGVRVQFVPYIHDTKQLQAILSGCKASYAFVHAGIAGARIQDTDYKVKEGLDLSTVDDIPIFSGHYHIPQTIGNAVYLGSPLHHSFSDTGQEKSFIELDLITGAYKRIPTLYPKFIKLQIDKIDDIYNIDSPDYYKLIVTDKTLSAEHFAHLQAHTKSYDVVYSLKKETQLFTSSIDSEFACLRKFIENEFDQGHLQLYKEAKRYLC